RRAPGSPTFPYTTLFRSGRIAAGKITQHIGGLRVRHLAADTAPGKIRRPAFKQPEGMVQPQSFEFFCRLPNTYLPLHKLTKGVRSEEHTSELQSRENLVC